MGSASSSASAARIPSNKPSDISLSKGEITKVKKLFHKLEIDNGGVVPLSTVIKLIHFRNNTLVKLVASQYARKQGTTETSSIEHATSGEEDIVDLEKFIELFEILSPKKSVSLKLEVIFEALKHKESGLITSQGLVDFYKLLLPGCSQSSVEALASSVLQQLHSLSADSIASVSKQDEVSFEDFSMAVTSTEILARFSVQL